MKWFVEGSIFMGEGVETTREGRRRRRKMAIIETEGGGGRRRGKVFKEGEGRGGEGTKCC